MNWRDLERAVDTIVGGTFAEPVRLSFLSNGVADPSRPAVEASGILHVHADQSTALGGDYKRGLSAGQAELVLDRSVYTGPAIRKGDKVRANSRTGQPWFEVQRISDRYSNLLIITLNEA